MQYDVVFEGGGAKGMVFVGALQEFEAAGHTYNRLLGTSAGAITAALLGAGYTSEGMLEALSEERNGEPVFAGFLGLPGPFDEDEIRTSATAEFLRQVDIPLVPDRFEEQVELRLITDLLRIERYRHVFSFIETGGWFTAVRFVEWMTSKLNEARDGRGGYGAMTLSEFFEATGSDVSLVASDTTAESLLVLNHRTAPDCPLVWAVRMSMSLPLVWPEVAWREDWGRYRGTSIAGHVVIDGGMLSNFPIALLLSRSAFTAEVMGEKESATVLGLLIDETKPVPGAPPREAEERDRIRLGDLRTVKRFLALVETMTKAHDKQAIVESEHLVVRLPAKGFGTTDFDMSAERRSALVAAGRAAMHDYLVEAAKPRRRPKALASDEERLDTTADLVAGQILGLRP